MGLHLHRAERTDLLAEGLGALLADPPDDPFAEELVLVPSRGVERWLSQRLSHLLGGGPGGDGVCAGVAFRSPESLIAEVTGAVDGDPWSPDAMVWPLLEVIDASLDEPWCHTLAAHLGRFHTGSPGDEEAELRRGRRYPVARRLAGLFASYARQRPQLLIDWLDGSVEDLDTDLIWQPPLWRALVEAVGGDPPHIRHHKTVTRLREGSTDNLPTRLSLFGHTRLACTDVDLLDALATHHDLHLWLPHPSDELWQRLAGLHGAVPRVDDTSRHAVVHPLLATLGRDLRELQRSLPITVQSNEYLSNATISEALLGWLQSDIAANALRPAGRVLSATDRSVQVHACHGPARQVDVLRDVLLGLLDDDPTLEPRDIVVMCPDIETYEPLVTAGFGLGRLTSGHPAHQLRVQLADRSLTQANPVLAVAAELLALADSRATASQVLNLMQAAPVRTRFAFTDDDMDTVTSWVREANIRWGLNRAHRAANGLDGIAANTWRFGLDRILTGVAMSDDAHAWLGTALPLDGVGSTQVELAGRLAEFVARLTAVLEKLCAEQTLAQWLDALRNGLSQLCQVGHDERWQTAQLQREFTALHTDAGSRAHTVLRLPDIRSLLAGRLAGRPTRANFRTGGLTVCAMVPMRSVPHRVVCLVGLDDGVFPRQTQLDGDDALARRPLTGERDFRSEDRQLLLDAICAATDTLVITYTGASALTGQRRPPAVPLAELLDVLDQTTLVPVRAQVLTRHPLQPFGIGNIKPGGLLADGRPFTFDETALQVARASAGPRHTVGSFLVEPLSAAPPTDIALTDLLAFFRHPVEGFFRALDYTLPREVETVDDAIPLQLNGRGQWHVGDRMVREMLRGTGDEPTVQAEVRRGALPPGGVGLRMATEIGDQATELATTAAPYRVGEPEAHDVAIELGDGSRLVGTVTQIYRDRLVSVTYSKLGCKTLLQAWIALVALAAALPGRDFTTVCVGRRETGEGVDQRVFATPADPHAILRDLVALYDAGLREPLPLPLKTSYAWARARVEGVDPWSEAQKRWKSGFKESHDDKNDAHIVVWGPDAALKDIVGQPRPGEEVPGETTRLGALAVRLWQPLFDAEQAVP